MSPPPGNESAAESDQRIPATGGTGGDAPPVVGGNALTRRLLRSDAFVSFNSPGYSSLFMAGLFSFLSVQMQFLLRGILAWDLTEREGALGLTYLCFGVAMLIATPIGGVATDRLPKRAVLIGSQAIIMTMAVFMGVAVLTDVIQFWMLLVAAVGQGAAFGFFGPARTAISAEVVGRDQLGNAISLTMLSMSGTRVFAPSVAGVLAGIATVGIGGAYLVAGTCSVVSFLYLLRLPASRPRDEATAAPAGAATTGAGLRPARMNPLAGVVDGVRYVTARPPLRRLILTSFVVIMFGFNYVAFLPALVKGEYGLGDGWVGLISSASAVGAVAVSLPLAARADSDRAGPVMVLAGLGFGLGVMGLGLAPSFWIAFVVICVVGSTTTVYQSLSNTLALAMSDDEHQGRVQSLMQLSFAGFGIAALPLGGLAEVIGLRPTIMIMGGTALAAMVVYAVLDGARGLVEAKAAARPAAPAGDPPSAPPPTTTADVGAPDRSGREAVGSMGTDDLAHQPAAGS